MLLYTADFGGQRFHVYDATNDKFYEKITKEDFIKRAKEVHPDKNYGYEKVDYKKGKEKVMYFRRKRRPTSRSFLVPRSQALELLAVSCVLSPQRAPAPRTARSRPPAPTRTRRACGRPWTCPPAGRC